MNTLTAKFNSSSFNATILGTGSKQSPILDAIAYNSTTLSVGGAGMTLESYVLLDPTTGQAPATPPSSDWWITTANPSPNQIVATLHYAFGTVAATYTVKGDSLNVDVVLTNTSKWIWCQKAISLLTPQLPGQNYTNTFEPAVPTWNAPTGAVAAVLTGNTSPKWYGLYSNNRLMVCDTLPPYYDNPNLPHFGTSRVWNAPYPADANSNPIYGPYVSDPTTISGALLPGGVETYRLSLRFAPAGTTAQQMAADYFEGFRARSARNFK